MEVFLTDVGPSGPVFSRLSSLLSVNTPGVCNMPKKRILASVTRPLSGAIFLSLITAWVIGLLSAVCVAIHVIIKAPSICSSIIDALWDQVPWHPAMSYLEVLPRAALTVVYLCVCSALLSRNWAQTSVSGLSTTFSTRLEHTLEYGTWKFRRNNHLQKPPREIFHSSQLPKELCANKRGSARLQQVTSSTLVKEMLIVCNATLGDTNQIWLKWPFVFHSRTSRNNQI